MDFTSLIAVVFVRKRKWSETAGGFFGQKNGPLFDFTFYELQTVIWPCGGAENKTQSLMLELYEAEHSNFAHSEPSYTSVKPLSSGLPSDYLVSTLKKSERKPCKAKGCSLWTYLIQIESFSSHPRMPHRIIDLINIKVRFVLCHTLFYLQNCSSASHGLLFLIYSWSIGILLLYNNHAFCNWASHLLAETLHRLVVLGAFCLWVITGKWFPQ